MRVRALLSVAALLAALIAPAAWSLCVAPMETMSCCTPGTDECGSGADVGSGTAQDCCRTDPGGKDDVGLLAGAAGSSFRSQALDGLLALSAPLESAGAGALTQTPHIPQHSSAPFSILRV